MRGFDDILRKYMPKIGFGSVLWGWLGGDRAHRPLPHGSATTCRYLCVPQGHATCRPKHVHCSLLVRTGQDPKLLVLFPPLLLFLLSLYSSPPSPVMWGSMASASPPFV